MCLKFSKSSIFVPYNRRLTERVCETRPTEKSGESVRRIQLKRTKKRNENSKREKAVFKKDGHSSTLLQPSPVSLLSHEETRVGDGQQLQLCAFFICNTHSCAGQVFLPTEYCFDLCAFHICVVITQVWQFFLLVLYNATKIRILMDIIWF